MIVSHERMNGFLIFKDLLNREIYELSRIYQSHCVPAKITIDCLNVCQI